MKSKTQRSLTAGIIFIYSLLMIATVIPSFQAISNFFVILYFLFIPGFSITLLFGDGYGLFDKLILSVILSLTIVLFLLAIRQLNSQDIALPYNVIIPIITILVTTYYYFFGAGRHVR